MKVIIDIPKTEFNHIKKVWSKRRGSIPYTNIAFGTPIPDNTTNGDVLKMLFPEYEFEKNKLYDERLTSSLGLDIMECLTEDVYVSKYWFNAPYESKEYPKND